MTTPARSSRGALKWTAIFVIGLFAVLFVLQKLGVRSVYRAETSSGVDFDASDYQDRPMPERREEDPSVVDNTLKDIAKLYAGEVFTDPREREKARENIRQLSEDEKKFYTSVKKQYSMSDQLRDAENWLNILRASRDTYREVQDVFGESGEKARVKTSAEDLTELLSNPVASALAFKKLQEIFGIPEAESKKFAARGNPSVSSWASWIDEQKKE